MSDIHNTCFLWATPYIDSRIDTIFNKWTHWKWLHYQSLRSWFPQQPLAHCIKLEQLIETLLWGQMSDQLSLHARSSIMKKLIYLFIQIPRQRRLPHPRSKQNNQPHHPNPKSVLHLSFARSRTSCLIRYPNTGCKIFWSRTSTHISQENVKNRILYGFQLYLIRSE